MLIRNGTLVTAEGTLRAEIRIEGERIAAIGDLAPYPSEPVVDAGGAYVLPGLVDPHVHIALNTGIYHTDDDWWIGTRAAAFGGITTVIDFATQFRGQRFEDALAARLEEAREKAAVDYALHMMVTDLPPGREGELGKLVEHGVSGIKLYTTYRPNYYADDAALLRVMRAAGALGLITMVHCENDAMVTEACEQLKAAGRTGLQEHGRSRPPLAEIEAVHRVLFLAAEARAPVYIVHCSTARSVDLVHEAAQRGQPAFAETCPQYLLLDETAYEGPHPEWYILQPPLRPTPEQAGLWERLRRGWIAAIGTDHCDYVLGQKTATRSFLTTPGGLPGLETMLPLLYTYGVAEGRIGWPDLVRLCATGPAKIFGLYPRKGSLQPGADADLVIYDPEPEEILSAARLHHIAGYTPYEGWRVRGRVRTVIARGQMVVEDGIFQGTPGWGRFLPAAPFTT
ncbi:MAG: dihydropyrimidinase [Thermoflexus sp.]|jgi:dihydropyrimidinase|nr:dihydropyrimidinase [Thermoflexus sp.]